MPLIAELAADWTFVSPDSEAELKVKRSGPLTSSEKDLLRSISASVLDGDTGFDKPVLSQYEQEGYRRTIKDYLAWQGAQVGAKLVKRADEIFAPGGEASQYTKVATRPGVAWSRTTMPQVTKVNTAAIVMIGGLGLTAAFFLMPKGIK